MQMVMKTDNTVIKVD